MTAPAPAGEGPQEGSNPLELALVAFLALVCLVMPFLYSSPSGEGASVGNELVFDGRELITGHEVLSAVPTQPGRVFETLTTTWWGGLQPESTLYRPLSSFVLGLGAVVSGETYDVQSPGSAGVPYKLFALSLKVICALLVVELGTLLLGSRRHGFIAGLLFATLPVHGDAIFDVAGTANLLATALSLGAWAAWLKAGDRPLSKPLALGGSVLLLFGAIHAHEAAYALPLVFFLGDVGRVREGGIGAGIGHALTKLPALVVCAVVLAVGIAIHVAVTGSIGFGTTSLSPVANPLHDAGLVTRVVTALGLMAGSAPVVAGLSPYSSNFSFSADYSAAQIPVDGAFALPNLIGLAGLVVAVLAAVALFTKCRSRASLVLCFFGSLLVSSNLLLPAEVIFAERNLVFPSAILAMFAAPFLAGLGSAGVIVALVIAAGNGAWTFMRADEWSSNADLWRHTATKTAKNSARASFYEGVSLAREQLFPLAVTKYDRAVELAPSFDLARVQQAAALMSNFRTEEALVPLRTAVENQIAAAGNQYEPDPNPGPLNLDLLLFQITQLDAMDAAGDPERNLAWLTSLIEGGYESPYAYLYRAETLSRLPAQDVDAEAAFKRSLEIAETAAGLRGYGSFLRQRGRNDEALELYRAASARFEAESSSANDSAASVEFKLQQADLEYLTDAQKAFDLASEVLAADSLNAEQYAKALILRAQTRLDLTPATDPVAAATAVADSSRDLQAALGTYQVQNEQTYVALYMLVDLLLQQGRLDVAQQAMLEIVSFRRAPVLHGRLADLYARAGRRLEASEQFELCVSGLTDAEGKPLDPGFYTATRMNQLHNLVAVGGQEAQIEAILATERARADQAAASIEAYWGAATANWAMMEDGIAALIERIGEAAVASTVKSLREYQEISAIIASNSLDAAALTFQAERALELFNLPRAQASILRSLELTPESETDAKAYRLGVLARVLERDRDPVAALERLREAVALPGVNPMGTEVMGEEIKRLEALLTP